MTRRLPTQIKSDKIKALKLDFVAWCVANGNQAGPIVSKSSAALPFHRLNLKLQLPASSPLITLALQGVTRSHVAAGTPNRVRRPILWDALLGGQGLPSSWGRAAEFFGCLSSWAIFLC